VPSDADFLRRIERDPEMSRLMDEAAEGARISRRMEEHRPLFNFPEDAERCPDCSWPWAAEMASRQIKEECALSERRRVRLVRARWWIVASWVLILYLLTKVWSGI
jgi:hypothetical protein